MKIHFWDRNTVITYVLIFCLFLILPIIGNRAIYTLAEANRERSCVVIDAGHGGIDCGAVSCTGYFESHINLEIALKLKDICNLIGIKTVMIRDTDKSVYTEGTTIASQKISDIKERVRVVNSNPNAILISIHQNNYHDSRYHGAQVFYNAIEDSKDFAEKLQTTFKVKLDQTNHRQTKRSEGVYLMEHAKCTAVLIECGFLSNYQEERNLRTDSFQQKICTAIAETLWQHLNT